MGILGPKCQNCKRLTVHIGATIGGARLYACGQCGLVYTDVKKPEK